MDNPKDTQKTNLNSYGHIDVSNIKSFQNNGSIKHSNKKTEKLVTALYMVTDCMDSDDALKGKLRLLGVELLSLMHKLPSANPADAKIHIQGSLIHVSEILSFMEVAYTVGYVSEMNTAILKREFMKLAKDLESFESKDKHFAFALDEKMFADDNLQSGDVGNFSDYEKNASIGHLDKRTSINNSSFKKDNRHNMILSPIKKFPILESSHMGKQERSDKILALIKDKKDISIKDISTAFTDCSEKTIQRELATLVSKGQIRKVGEKRWSRYQAI